MNLPGTKSVPKMHKKIKTTPPSRPAQWEDAKTHLTCMEWSKNG
jgi:hypothetical protein